MKKYFEKSTFVSRVHNKQHDGHSRSGTIQCNKSVELLNIIHTLHDMLYVVYKNIQSSRNDKPIYIYSYNVFLHSYMDLLESDEEIENKILEGRRILIKVAAFFPEKYLKYGDNHIFKADDYIKTFSDVLEQGLNSSKETGKAKLYLMNRTEFGENLDILKSKPQHRVLDTDYWHLGINAAFIQGGINTRSRFKIKTKLLEQHDIDIITDKYDSGADFLKKIQYDKAISPILYNHRARWFNTKVLAREIAQLIDAGYIFVEVKSKSGKNTLQALPDRFAAHDYQNKKALVTD